MSAVYLVVLSVLFLNFYTQSYRKPPTSPAATHTAAEPVTKSPQKSPDDVITPADVTSGPAQPLTPAEERVEKSTEHRVGTLSHFVKAMMSHGFGCFIKED